MMRPFFFLLILVLPGVLVAQEGGKTRMRFVRAAGEATVSVKPDRAEITIGVSTRAPSAQDASAQNAGESGKLQAAIKGALGDKGTVKTAGYSLSPQYDYSAGHAPRLTGYEANNTVTVTVDDLSLLGKIIDSATTHGANNINGISFLLKDSSAVRSQALAEAATKARSHAEAIAKALGLTVIAVMEAEPTENPVVRPMVRQFAAMQAVGKAMPSTPVEAGDLDIHASVTVTLAVQ